MDQAEASLAIGNRIQTIDSVEFPSRFGSAKVSAVIFAKEPIEAWAKTSTPGFNSRGCRHEATQPEVEMSSYCRTDRVSFRNIY
jgi:hypothetical protein